MDFFRKVIIFAIFLFLKRHPVLGEPYVSEWQTISSQTLGPYSVPHPLGEYPAKVDVQIKIKKNGHEYIFSGFGSAQRDDDFDRYYGGIVYVYNEKHVQLYVPMSTGNSHFTDKGGVVYTGGEKFYGPFRLFKKSAKVRVRVWRVCDFPPADFVSSGKFKISSEVAENSFVEIEHGLRSYPQFAVTQLLLSDGYISEANGAAFLPKAQIATSGAKNNAFSRLCGVVFAYNNISFRLWTPYRDEGHAVSVVCVIDGWGKDSAKIRMSSANIYIRAWIFEPHNIVFWYSFEIGKNIEIASYVNLGHTFPTSSHVFNVQIKNKKSGGYIFNGVGSAMSDGSFGKHGGIIYAHNESHVLLWRPSDSNSDGSVIYIGNEWGNGEEKMSADVGDLIVSVLFTGSQDTCGYSCYDNVTYSKSCNCQSTLISSPIILKRNPIPVTLKVIRTNNNVLDLQVNISTPQHHLYHLDVYIITKEKTGTRNSGISINSVIVGNVGENIKCYSTAVHYHSSINNSIINNTTVNLHIVNYGTNKNRTLTSYDDVLTLDVTLLPEKSKVNAKDVCAIEVELYYLNDEFGDMEPYSVDYEVMFESKRQEHAQYKISIYSSCENHWLPKEGTYEINLNITSERNKEHMLLQLEFPLKDNSSDISLVISSFDVITFGKNLPLAMKSKIHMENETMYENGTLRNVIIVIPEMNNTESVDDDSEDVLALRILVRLYVGNVTEQTTDINFRVAATYNNATMYYSHCISILQPVKFPAPVLVRGSVFGLRGSTNISAFLTGSLTYSVDRINYVTVNVTWVKGSGNFSHMIYYLSKPLLATTVMMGGSDMKITCCIDQAYIVSNLQDYIDILDDPFQSLLGNISTIFDGRNDTCLALPVVGMIPPIFWIKMDSSVLLGITSKRFQINLIGKGISCHRHGTNILQVSFPTSYSFENFKGNFKFCELIKYPENALGELNLCTYLCDCSSSVVCDDILVFMATLDKHYSWSLCEIYQP